MNAHAPIHLQIQMEDIKVLNKMTYWHKRKGNKESFALERSVAKAKLGL